MKINKIEPQSLIRVSNTQPVLVMRFEAETEEKLEEYRKSFEEIIKRLAREVVE